MLHCPPICLKTRRLDHRLGHQRLKVTERCPILSSAKDTDLGSSEGSLLEFEERMTLDSW